MQLMVCPSAPQRIAQLNDDREPVYKTDKCFQTPKKSASVRRSGLVGRASSFRRATDSVRENPSLNALTNRLLSASGGSQKQTSKHLRGATHVTFSPPQSMKVRVRLSAEICG